MPALWQYGRMLADKARIAAYEAARALSRGRNYCKSIQGAISLYATGRTCRWEGAEKRARFVTRLMGRY